MRPARSGDMCTDWISEGGLSQQLNLGSALVYDLLGNSGLSLPASFQHNLAGYFLKEDYMGPYYQLAIGNLYFLNIMV